MGLAMETTQYRAYYCVRSRHTHTHRDTLDELVAHAAYVATATCVHCVTCNQLFNFFFHSSKVRGQNGLRANSERIGLPCFRIANTWLCRSHASTWSTSWYESSSNIHTHTHIYSRMWCRYGLNDGATIARRSRKTTTNAPAHTNTRRHHIMRLNKAIRILSGGCMACMRDKRTMFEILLITDEWTCSIQ